MENGTLDQIYLTKLLLDFGKYIYVNHIFRFNNGAK